MNSSITIVTAFFDIGRGNWTADKGYSPHLERTSDTYIEYFKNLASLDNEMVIFTSSDLKPEIEKIRQGKPTTVIDFDIHKKFNNIKKQISKIQQNANFRDRLEVRQLKNPEYWSPDYVLVCNLKSYFVTNAIALKLVSHDMVAWVDFGYCRDTETTRNLSQWNYPFNKNKINLFTIKKGLKTKSVEHVFDHMIDNRVFIIGGAVVATKEKWNEFYKLVCHCQKETLRNNIVDDDQGIFIMCHHYRPDLIKLNFLGKGRWFNLFKVFGKRDVESLLLYLKIRIFGK